MNSGTKEYTMFLFLMSFLMSTSMSFIMLAINTGIHQGFFGSWLRILLSRSFPVSLFVIFITTKFFRGKETIKSRALRGIILGFVMSFIITATRFGVSHSNFFAMWLRSFVIGVTVATPLAIIWMKVVRKIVNICFKQSNGSI